MCGECVSAKSRVAIAVVFTAVSGAMVAHGYAQLIKLGPNGYGYGLRLLRS